MKYDSQITELKNLLSTAKNILIATPAGSDIDKLAAGLSLFLSFEAAGKQVSIVCDDNILVGQSHLFGIDHVQKNLPSTEGGNLILTLEGVAASDGTVPALEKLDWYAENNNLNLVFHVMPNQTFQPTKIVPKFQGSGFDLIFVVGAVNLNALGNIYQQNNQAFSGTHLINLDNQSSNTSFGQTNVIDPQASSLSEITSFLMADLGLGLDGDSASNLLAGIFEATKNLLGPKATPDTYMAVANCLRAGGKKPGAQTEAVHTEPQAQPLVSDNPLSTIAAQQPAYDWNAVAAAIGQSSPSAQTGEFPVPPVISQDKPSDNMLPSSEERPFGEGVVSETVEPEWLTPKIFKGSSLN